MPPGMTIRPENTGYDCEGFCAGVDAERARILAFLASAFTPDEDGHGTAEWVAKFVRAGHRLEDINAETAAEIWREDGRT